MPVDITTCRNALDLLLKRGLEQDSYSASHLIRGFAASSSLDDAYHVFSILPIPNIFAWSAIIDAHTKHGLPHKALSLFTHLHAYTDIRPDAHLFVVAIKACSALLAKGLHKARSIHSQVVEYGYAGNTYIGSALIDMYVKCGSLRDGFVIFCDLERQDVVTFTCMLGGFVQHGCYEQAFWIFEKMQKAGIDPNQASFVNIAKACIEIREVELGMILHALVVEKNYELDNVVLNGIIDMYAKCGRMDDAMRVFNRFPPGRRDLVTWCTILSGLIDLGRCRDARFHIWEMRQQHETLKYDQGLFVCLLKVCAYESALCQGMMVHSVIIMETKLVSDVTIGNTLLNMYLRCDRYVEACKVFSSMRSKNVVSWSTMMKQSKECSLTTVEEFLQAMDRDGYKPNDVTYGCILSSFRDENSFMLESLGTLIHRDKIARKDGGFLMIESLSCNELWNLTHYNCIVNHLGHIGQLNEAIDILKTMPHKENNVGWTSLLSSCKMYSHVDLGNQCFERVREMEGDEKSSSYLLMESIYSAQDMLDEAKKVESLRHGKVWNIMGRATIELLHKTHEFSVGDQSHDMNREINDKLKLMHIRIKWEGYIPRFQT